MVTEVLRQFYLLVLGVSGALRWWESASSVPNLTIHAHNKLATSQEVPIQFSVTVTSGDSRSDRSCVISHYFDHVENSAFGVGWHSSGDWQPVIVKRIARCWSSWVMCSVHSSFFMYAFTRTSFDNGRQSLSRVRRRARHRVPRVLPDAACRVQDARRGAARVTRGVLGACSPTSCYFLTTILLLYCSIYNIVNSLVMFMRNHHRAVARVLLVEGQDGAITI